MPVWMRVEETVVPVQLRVNEVGAEQEVHIGENICGTPVRRNPVLFAKDKSAIRYRGNDVKVMRRRN